MSSASTSWVQIEITEGEREALVRRFPEKRWTQTPKLTVSGIGRLRFKHDEMERQVKMNTGTKKHSPGLAYDVEMLGRILEKLPDE